MSEPLRILHVENDLDDAELVRTALVRGGLDVALTQATTREEFIFGLHGEVDLILSDSGVPGLDASTALAMAETHEPPIPFLLVSGSSPAGPLARLGARCVPKHELHHLAKAVRGMCGKADPPPASLDRGMERLIAVVQELSQVRDLPALMAIVCHAARELTGADGATFVLRDGDFCHYADEEAVAPLWKGQRLPMSACVSGWAMLNRQSAVIEDVYADPRILPDAYRPTFVKSLLMVPVRVNAPLGAIGTYWARPHRATPKEARLLQALADSASIATENVQRYEDLERRVAESTAELEAAHAELESFSFSVSHDLRSPLRVIEGFSDLLLTDASAELDGTTLDHLQRIRRASLRMGQLIEDLLQLSRVTRAELVREPVDLSLLAGQILADLRAGEPGRPVETHVAPSLQAKGDPRLLRTALEHLLGNAWKYTSRTEGARIAFTREAEGERPFVLRDNGAGFEMSQVRRLFGAFQRLHSEKEFPGAGVGLATVKRILMRHRGRIWAEAAPGQGAAFYFTLPD